MLPRMSFVTLDEVRAAAERLPSIVRHTPLWPCALDWTQVGDERLFLKLENMQPTGAFKIRAAFNMAASLTPEQRRMGLVFASSGNFAQAFALAGTYFGIRTCVVMLATTSPYKIEATRALGAEVDLFDGPAIDRQRRVEEIAEQRGMASFDTWEEHEIIAGHATIGLEVVTELPDLEQVLVPVSSGGLAAGVATAVKHLAPRARVIGVQPREANAAYRSLTAGEPVAINDWSSIADGLSARRPGERPFAHLQRYIDEIVLIDEQDIAVAHMALRRRAKTIAEPAGAVAAAAFISERVDTKLTTVAVVSGGNLTEDTMHILENMATEAR